MKRKLASLTLVLAAAGLISAPMAAAAPGDATDVNTKIGQAISSIAKTGGGNSAVLNQLQQLKPANAGIAKAVQNAVKNAQANGAKVTAPTASDISAVRNQIGKAISEAAKNGGGASGVLTQLQQLKPNNTGIANALNKLLPKVPVTPAP